MRILIIGGTGFISGQLATKLLEAGHDVTVLTRGQSASPLKPQESLYFIQGDRGREDALRNALSLGPFDAVYDMVAYQPEESRLAANVFRGHVGRFIHCSTISVYMVSDAVQCPITEDQDKRPLMEFFARNPFGMEYGINKRKCEDVLWEAHDEKAFPVSMLRPTYVSGPRDPMRREYFWIQRILDGQPVLVPGSGDFAFQIVFVDDLARMFVDLLDHPSSIGQAYNAVGEEILSLNEYIRLLGSLLERQPELIHVDQALFDKQSFSISTQGDVFPFNARRTAIFSLDKIKRDLVGYHSTPIREWLLKTIDWYLNAFGGHSTGYERRREEIDFARKWQESKKEWLHGFG